MVCAPAPSGCLTWQSPSEGMLTGGGVDIDAGATAFTAYGVLEVQLTSDVDADHVVACLRDTRVNATTADSPTVTSVTAKGSGRYALGLSRYQLPVAYELVMAIGSPPAVRRAVLAPDLEARVAFVSTTQGGGDLASWSNANSGDPLVAADEVCTAEANAAGLGGDYTAFLSAATPTAVDAVCRLRGGEGVVAAGCGGADLSEEQLRAPYLDMKGLPIAYGTADIEAGAWRLPVGYTSAGTRVTKSTDVWTGSTLKGVLGATDCEGWSSASDAIRGMANDAPGTSSPAGVYSSTCDGHRSLLCFSAGEGHPLTRDHERSGKKVFVVELGINTVVDMASADAACQAASESSDTLAWFSDENDDALCRLVGMSGKATQGCGQDVLPVVNGPWVRPDGYLVAESSQALVDEGPQAPVLLSFDGSFEGSDGTPELVRTDTQSWGGRGGISPALSCLSGSRHRIDSGWTYVASTCSSAVAFRAFVYCFERTQGVP